MDRHSSIKDAAAEIVQDTQQGDPNVLTQFGTFELTPWEGAWSGQGQWNVPDSERWYKGLAAGIGNARALVILQMDLPFAAKTRNQQPETIDAYGTKVLSADRHTTVYIDAGAFEWLSPAEQGALLISNGIRHARGFSVNDTQYGSTSQELGYGAQVLAYLNAHGVTGKHFLVNTAQNGQPYLAGQVSGPSNDTPGAPRARRRSVSGRESRPRPMSPTPGGICPQGMPRSPDATSTATCGCRSHGM